MFATTSTSSATRTVRIKSLESSAVRDEQKDLEDSVNLESEQLAEVEEAPAGLADDFESAPASGLSTRAAEIKALLSEQRTVKAVLLKADGNVEEIQYNTSSSGTRQLLSGIPTVIGSLDEISAILVTSKSSTPGGATNKCSLPVPLSLANKAQGDIVAFCVDAQGQAGDLALSDYSKYVERNKTLTATALKNHNFEEQPIRNNGSGASATLNLQQVRGSIQAHFYEEIEHDEQDKWTTAEVEAECDERLQQMVDEAVAAFSLSPMEDPDFDPEEEGLDEDAELEVVGARFDYQEAPEKGWRQQLNEALEIVKDLGRSHGEAFAERLCSTFYEVNGSEPSLETMLNLYERVRTDFENEAEEELDDSEDEEVESSSESVSLEIEGWSSVLEHVREVAREDGSNLVENLCDLFAEEYGEEPSLDELAELWDGIQDALAEEAAEDSEDSGDDDEAYDPSNDDDVSMAEMDSAADRKFEQDHYEMVMLNTPATASKLGNALSWAVYFDEEELCSEAESANLEQAVSSFAMRNGQAPNALEVAHIKAFLAVPNELCAEEDTSAFDMSASSVQSSRLGHGASWTAFFNEGSSKGSVRNAAKAFQAVHGREPTSFELDRIRSFLSTPSQLAVVDSRANSWAETVTRPAVVQVTPVKAKKAAKSFSVYMSDAKLSATEREQVALKWFDRFQKRKPTDGEMANIRSFLTKDAETTDHKFLVSALDFADLAEDQSDDDQKEDQPANTTSSAMVTKKAAVGFTLNFDDEEAAAGDKEEAIRWFKRFNNREPDADEAANIASFVQADDEAADTVDIE